MPVLTLASVIIEFAYLFIETEAISNQKDLKMKSTGPFQS